jgi:hypothetical protein
MALFSFGKPDRSKEAEKLFDQGLEKYLKKDYPEAFQFFTTASELGSGDADCHLGIMYELGCGFPQNLTLAFKWFEQSAQRNSCGGLYRLGRCYQEGIGVSIDKKKALYWHRRAAAKDNRLAPYSIQQLESEGIE